MRAAKQDDCSCVLRPCEQQTLAIFFCHLGFTTAQYQWGHIARVSQIARHSGYVTPLVEVEWEHGGKDGISCLLPYIL